MVRDPAGPEVRRLRTSEPGTLVTSLIVAAELRFGYTRRRSARLERSVEDVLATIEVLDWSTPCDRVYAALRADLERRGALIGPMDMMIAAHALALDAVLVTDNEREFGCVAGLKTENWIR